MKCPLCETLYIYGGYNYSTEEKLDNHILKEHDKTAMIRFIEIKFRLDKTELIKFKFITKQGILDWIKSKVESIEET